MKPNRFKQALANQQRQIGVWLSLGDATSAEICAGAGFDWALIDGEHTPHHMLSMLDQLRAVELGGAHGVMRVASADATLIKQALDMGAQSLLIPMVDDAQQAARTVQATRYAPEGFRGVGASAARATRWDREDDYLDWANESVCLLVQAETVRALQNLESICAVDGVDGVFIGPADLSASLGHRGNPTHPEVQAAMKRAVRTINASGKAAGILLPDVELAKEYLELGATFVSVGIDVFVLAQGIRKLASEFRLGSVSKARYRASY